jgi:cation-transporting ATPase 13A2
MTKKLKSKSIEVYVKGAPEVMVDICDKASCEPLSCRVDFN